MEIERLNRDFTVCKVKDFSEMPLDSQYCFACKTDEENSLVCPTGCVPKNLTAREDGFQGFRIKGAIDFSCIGILSGISRLLSENSIPIFAVSTYNTDYFFVKGKDYEQALHLLTTAGWQVV